MRITPVILTGGSGTRLWPLSRSQYSKQFLPLIGERSMLQQTVDRLTRLSDLAAPIFICNEAHRFLVAEQVNDCAAGTGAIILEPVPRNTAPAVAIAALEASATADDTCLLVLPADHHIQDPETLCKTIELACQGAATGALMTFGTVPNRAETGYGYIALGQPLKNQLGDSLFTDGLYEVSRFIEKPDKESAQRYVEDGNYLWNSGMFLFYASRYIDALQQYAPEILEACRQAHNQAKRQGNFITLTEAFSCCPADSIDYAVMEHAQFAGVVPLDAGWSDVGSWDNLLEVNVHDANNNVIKGDVIVSDVKESYICSESRMVAVVGVSDQVIVETPDAILVSSKDKSEEVKEIVSRLKQQQRSEIDNHKRVRRPWGWYETIDEGNTHKVKRIMVKPGASLSLQKHHYRAEHWVVVKGTAQVTRNNETFLLEENESTFIPIGGLHRLSNPVDDALEVIEVQSGDYLGEDDIVRFEDIYGRAAAE